MELYCDVRYTRHDGTSGSMLAVGMGQGVDMVRYYTEDSETGYPAASIVSIRELCAPCNGEGGAYKGNAPKRARYYGSRDPKWWRECTRCNGRGTVTLPLLPTVNAGG